MTHPGFVVEFNRPTVYGKQLSEHLVSLGMKSRQLVHKTAWWVTYDGVFADYKDLKHAVARSINKRLGSALVISRKTGRTDILRWRNPHKFFVTKVK